jgi:hypothetical protein
MKITRNVLTKAVLAWLLSFADPSSAQSIVHIPDGDNEGLATALSATPANGWVRIKLAPGGSYVLSDNVVFPSPSIGSTLVEIDGNGASLLLDDAVVQVGQNTAVRIQDTEITPILNRSQLLPQEISSFHILSGGQLALERTAVVNGRLSGGRAAYVLLVRGGGSLSAENVTFSGNQITARGAVLNNLGETMLTHTTVVGNVRAGGVEPAAPAGIGFLTNSVNGAVRVTASIIDACASAVADLDGNVSIDPRCGISTVVNALALDALSKSGSLVSTLAPMPWSPAVGIVEAGQCSAVDARGLSRLGIECDAGAHQSGGGVGRQDVGGINGTWYQPENDGHYVVVNRNSPTELVIIWMTFDKLGNQAWVYSVANFDGVTGSGPAFVNRDGILGPDGVPHGQAAETWGTMSVSFSSCGEALLSFDSGTSEFGSGEVQLSRLSEVNSIGCASLSEQ